MFSNASIALNRLGALDFSNAAQLNRSPSDTVKVFAWQTKFLATELTLVQDEIQLFEQSAKL